MKFKTVFYNDVYGDEGDSITNIYCLRSIISHADSLLLKSISSKEHQQTVKIIVY